MLTKLRFLLCAFLFLGIEASAVTADDYMIVFCDSCNTSSQFEQASKVAETGYVLVFNIENSVVNAYELIYEPLLGGTLSIPLASPPEAIEAIEMYHDIKQFYLGGGSTTQQLTLRVKSAQSSSTMSSISGPFGLHCGPSDNPTKASFIPDGIFEQACNNHDGCYAGGFTKGLCDAVFRRETRIAAEVAASAAGNAIARELARKILVAVADEYAAIVEESQDALDAYCLANPDSQTCSMELYDPATNPGGGNFELVDSEFGNLNVGFVTYVYECFTYYIYYSDGTVSRLEQCAIVPQ